MLDKRPADFEQRLQALDPTLSFLCEAPAGSGKTELLTQRFLTLLGGVNRPEELLAITFTRKATAEMRERIIGALRTGRGPEPETENQRITWRAARNALAANDKHGWDLLYNPGRLQIQTFDGLCARLTRALPVHSTFGAPPAITDTPEELYQQAVRQLFQSLEQEVSWTDELGLVLTHLDNNFQTLEELCVRLLARRQELLPLLSHGGSATDLQQRLELYLQHVVDDAVARVRRIMPIDCQRELLELAGFAAGNLRRENRESAIRLCQDIVQLPDSSVAGMAQWFGLLEVLLTGQDQWRSAVDRKIGFPVQVGKAEQALFRSSKQQMTDLIDRLRRVPGLKEALCDLRHVPAMHYEDDQLAVLEALMTLLKLLTGYLTLVFSERNCVDYAELSIRARQALGSLDNPTDLALALDYRIRHILVDEFQDVSTAQVALLRLLTAGWQPGDGHTLFCVGDAMQSIYGFRDSNVGLFIDCKEHGLGQVPLEFVSLNTNFRSTAGIVEWVNNIFASAFPARNDISSGAVQYATAAAYDQTRPADAVQVLGFSGHMAATGEAEAVVSIISSIRMERPQASIAVLVRNRKDAGHIVTMLRSNDIRYRAVELEPLAKLMPVQDLLSLCQAMLHPADRVAWLAVLRAPWCGLTLSDLYAVANTGDNSVLTLVEQLHLCLDREDRRSLLSEDGCKRLERVAPVLYQALATQGRKPLRQWLEGLWLELGGPACLEQPSDLDNAEKFFTLLETLDSGALPEYDTISKAVARLYAAPDPASDANLQIMTIHKAKGLEFDVVIVPSLHRRPRSTAAELILWQERLTNTGERELNMAPIPARGGDMDRTYAYLREEQRKKDAYETCRLLYVACTRARQRLYLLTHVDRNDETADIRAPNRTSLLHAIWTGVQPELRVTTSEQMAAVTMGTEQPAYLLRHLQSDWALPRLPERELLLNSSLGAGESAIVNGEDLTVEDEIDETVGPDPVARHVGTVVHETLQEIGRSGLVAWNNERLDRCRPYWQARLATLGIPVASVNQALDTVREAMMAILRDPNFLWMLSDQHTMRHCEYSLSIPVHQGYRNLIIDLLLQDQRGQTWIIDYKTGRPGPNEDPDVFISRRMGIHADKMSLYRRAVAHLGYTQVKAALYFPLLGKLSEYQSS